MKVWELVGLGLESLRQAERDIPEPGDNEVLVRVSAVSLNARDKLLGDGVYNPDLHFPMIQGSDAGRSGVSAQVPLFPFVVKQLTLGHLRRFASHL